MIIAILFEAYNEDLKIFISEKNDYVVRQPLRYARHGDYYVSTIWGEHFSKDADVIRRIETGNKKRTKMGI